MPTAASCRFTVPSSWSIRSPRPPTRCERPDPAAVRMPRPPEELAGLGDAVAGRPEPRVVAGHARGQDAARGLMAAEEDLLDGALAVQGVRDGAAHARVVEPAHPGVEAVEPHREGRAAQVLVARVRGLVPARRRHRALLELPLLELLADQRRAPRRGRSGTRGGPGAARRRTRRGWRRARSPSRAPTGRTGRARCPRGGCRRRRPAARPRPSGRCGRGPGRGATRRRSAPPRA